MVDCFDIRHAAQLVLGILEMAPPLATHGGILSVFSGSVDRLILGLHYPQSDGRRGCASRLFARGQSRPRNARLHDRCIRSNVDHRLCRHLRLVGGPVQRTSSFGPLLGMVACDRRIARCHNNIDLGDLLALALACAVESLFGGFNCVALCTRIPHVADGNFGAERPAICRVRGPIFCSLVRLGDLSKRLARLVHSARLPWQHDHSQCGTFRNGHPGSADAGAVSTGAVPMVGDCRRCLCRLADQFGSSRVGGCRPRSSSSKQRTMSAFLTTMAWVISMSWWFIALLVIIGYAWVVRTWLHRWKEIPVQPWSPVHATRSELTAIIPCRNEAKNLPHLLQDLRRQSLQLDIIVVDDASEDNTAGIAEALGVTVISSPTPGKKSALIAGIQIAQTEWIATLDADVRLGEFWAEAMVMAALQQDATAVIGSVTLRPHLTAWDRFQALEYGAMMVWIGGGVNAKGLAMGSGANLLFRREDYPTDSLALSLASGDDTFALEAIRKNKGRLVWQGDARARATTAGTATWFSLWTQRGRWASKTPHLNDPETILIAVLVGAVQCALLIWSLAAAWTLTWPFGLAMLSLWMLKIAIDYRLLKLVAFEFEIHVRKRDLFQFAPRYLILVLGAWIQILRRKVVWKGRRI